MKKIFLASLISFFASTPTFLSAVEVPLLNAIAVTSSNGATARTQLANRAASYCTLQARPNNTGVVYVGGYTVTNSSGVNQGIALPAGASYGNIRVTNSNQIYIASDTTGDGVLYACN